MLRGFPGGKAFLDSFGVKINASYISPLCFWNNIHIKLAIHFSLEEKIVKNYLHLSKLASQMVTSTPSVSPGILVLESLAAGSHDRLPTPLERDLAEA